MQENLGWRGDRETPEGNRGVSQGGLSDCNAGLTSKETVKEEALGRRVLDAA